MLMTVTQKRQTSYPGSSFHSASCGGICYPPVSYVCSKFRGQFGHCLSHSLGQAWPCSWHCLSRQGLPSSPPQASLSEATNLCLVPLPKFHLSEMHSLRVTGCGTASLELRPPLLDLPESQQPPPIATTQQVPLIKHRHEASVPCQEPCVTRPFVPWVLSGTFSIPLTLPGSFQSLWKMEE